MRQISVNVKFTENCNAWTCRPWILVHFTATPSLSNLTQRERERERERERVVGKKPGYVHETKQFFTWSYYRCTQITTQEYFRLPELPMTTQITAQPTRGSISTSLLHTHTQTHLLQLGSRSFLQQGPSWRHRPFSSARQSALLRCCSRLTSNKHESKAQNNCWFSLNQNMKTHSLSAH